MQRIRKAIFVTLLLVMLITAEQLIILAHPTTHTTIKLLPIDPRYFPADEYDYSKFEGMVIPDGPGPVCPLQSEIPGGGWVQSDVDYESTAVGCRIPGLVAKPSSDGHGLIGGTPRRNNAP